MVSLFSLLIALSFSRKVSTTTERAISFISLLHDYIPYCTRYHKRKSASLFLKATMGAFHSRYRFSGGLDILRVVNDEANYHYIA